MRSTQRNSYLSVGINIAGQVTEKFVERCEEVKSLIKYVYAYIYVYVHERYTETFAICGVLGESIASKLRIG